MKRDRLPVQLRNAAESTAARLGVFRLARRSYRQCFNRDVARHGRVERDFYRQFIRSGDLVFDIGANVGERTAVFLDLGARVVAVEPNPTCADVIRRRYACRSLVVEPCAVGKDVGSAQLHVAKRDAFSSLHPGWVPSNMVLAVVDVQSTTVDALSARHGLPAFVKIDVEGHEEAVLAGMQQPVAQFSFELHSGDLSAAKRCVDLVRRPEMRFNLSWGESMSFELPGWVDARELQREFDRIELARRGELLYGDVYVRNTSLLAALAR